MSDIVDDFINKVRAHPTLQSGHWQKQIGDFDKVLQALFIYDNERAIEMFDEIRGVMERKHIAIENHGTGRLDLFFLEGGAMNFIEKSAITTGE